MSASEIGLPGHSARTVLAALDSRPVRLLVLGGVGTGKSTALQSVRRALRDSGHTVTTRPPEQDDDAAVVIDDAHALSDGELRRLADIADRSDRTVVVAAQPRYHQPGLTALTAALEREHPPIALGPLSTGETARALTDPSGHPPPGEVLDLVMAASAGIPFLVTAVASQPRSASAIAGRALNERLRRLDPEDLEALLITSLSTDLGASDLAAALDVTAARAAALVDNARGTGLVEPSHPPAFLRAVHRAAGTIVGAARHHEIENALLRTQLASSTLSCNLALELAEHGVRDDRLAGWLREHADDDRDPAARSRLLRAAVDAGASDLRAALADAQALCGDCAAAAALADDLLAAPEPGDRVAGARVAGSVAAHDGNTAYAAELFTWLGPVTDAAVCSAAAIVYTACGDLAAAHQAMELAHCGPPTAAARSARSLADGIVLSAAGPYYAAAARLGQAVAGDHLRAPVAMPDSAPALVALAALHSGDAVRARSVIGRAVRAGSDPAYAARHRLLQGWVRMQDGQLAAAAADADAAGDGLHARDALWAAALRTAIARRGGDSGGVTHHLAAGFDVLAEYSVDLFSLPPLGELWMAAARMRQQSRLVPALDQAFGVLEALGRPAAWSVMLHWSGVHAGILAGEPAAVAPHGQALTALADVSPFAAALASAGRAWLQILTDQVDAEAVTAAARALAGHGLTSDATRLAGQAALQAADPKVSALMLQLARDLKLAVGEAAVDTGAEPAAPAGPATAALSEREREVAELLVRGMPYRDIGAQLFISAKTVEHHVARIRRRLGAQSRSEMLSMLRAILA
jgi:DNA-binding NarL/FixJ family response regulator